MKTPIFEYSRVHSSELAPTYITSCGCGEIGQASVKSSRGRTDLTIKDKLCAQALEREGWCFRRKPTCPSCVAKRKAPTATVIPIKKEPPAMAQPSPKPRPSEQPPRTPTPADRKKINAALEGEYDDEKGRYLGDASDKTIAKALGMPHAWVAEVRVLMFGEGAGNEAVEKGREEVEALKAELVALEKQAFALAERADKATKALAAALDAAA